MKKLLARLFAPQYQQVVHLNDGRTVDMTSTTPFTVDDVANQLRPTPKVSKFRVALPWILVAIFAIGLAVSGYFNWQQHQTILEWEYYYEGLREDYDDLYDYYNASQNDNQNLSEQVYQLKQDRQELLDELDQMSDIFDEINSSIGDINSDTYSLWYDLYYNDVAPSVGEMEDVNQATDDLDDYLDNVIYELDNYIYNFGW